MKKEEFLKQENVPQFIKDLVASAPGNPDISMTTFKVEGKAVAAETATGVERCLYPNGIDVYSYMCDINRIACDLIELTDDQVRLKKDDAARALTYASRLSGVLAQLCIRLSDCVNEGK